MSKEITNLEYLQSLNSDQFAAAFMVFRPSDKCFDDDERNYYALDNTWHKHSQDCFKANLKWLKETCERKDDK